MRQIDAVLHVKGESQYVDDVPPPEGLLQAAVFGSPLAHGRINSLDLTAARQVEGVLAVLSAADIPGENQIGPIIADEAMLATGEVHYIGQPVAIVVATSRHIARQGVAVIEIDCSPLPVIVDPREAFEQNEIIGAPRTIARGDVDAVWDECDLVLEGSCDLGGQEHVYLETQRSRAIPLEGGRLRIHASTQSPYAGQRMIARILGIPFNRIEIDVQRLGGAFGGKEDQATQWACVAALSAWHTGRPVEIVLSRAEDMRMTGKRHPYRSDFKIGLSAEGRIVAYQVEHYQNAGAGADLSPAVLERTLLHSTGSYAIPNVRLFGVSCRTNLPPNTAFRGFGGPQGMFVMECAIARAAEAMGKPVAEIQRLNLLGAGDHFPYGQPTASDHAQKTWDQAARSYDLSAIENRITAHNQTHFETKRGVAVMPVCFGISFTTTYMNQASALLHVYSDGSVGLSTGGVEMGQGLHTNLAGIAATALGINPTRIRVESTNTTRIANMSPSAASSTTLLNGNAVLLAANQILARLKSLAAAELDLSGPADVSIADEQVLVGGQPAGLSWTELVGRAFTARTGLSAHGYYATPEIHFDKATEQGSPFAYHVNGAAIIEVTLDCLRGTHTIDSVKITHDLGRSLNERIDLGQIEGGLAQGLGWMSLEDLQYGSDGTLLSPALATYKVPDAHFMPDDIQTNFIPNADSATGPYGSKAVGEPPLMYGIGLFFALRRAMRAFRPDLDLPFVSPLTPERILMALYPEGHAQFPVVTGAVQATL